MIHKDIYLPIYLNGMKRRDYLAMIAHDMGAIFELIGFASLVPFVVLIFYQEWEMVIPMASVPIAFMALGLLISQIPTGEYTPHLSIALVTVALTWFFIAVIGAIPFVLGLQMSFTDSMFEAMSGWTTTGFTMMTALDTAPRTLIFWRSLMQWLGGIGVIAFTIAMQTVTGLGYSQLFRSEGRTEAFTPSVVSTGRRIWGIYVVLTVIFTILIMLSGLSFWDALNLVMSTLSTGGFSIHDAGIRYYQNITLEVLLIPVMIAGALPFKLYFILYQKRDLKILRDATWFSFSSSYSSEPSLLPSTSTSSTRYRYLPLSGKGRSSRYRASPVPGFRTRICISGPHLRSFSSSC
jgi:trk system potassium uptake protein